MRDESGPVSRDGRTRSEGIGGRNALSATLKLTLDDALGPVTASKTRWQNRRSCHQELRPEMAALRSKLSPLGWPVHLQATPSPGGRLGEATPRAGEQLSSEGSARASERSVWRRLSICRAAAPEPGCETASWASRSGLHT